jgi:hypothetical protein
MTPNAGLNLSSAGAAYMALVGVATTKCSSSTLFVAPGDIDHSYLVNKLSGMGTCSGGRMPKNAAPLLDSEMGIVRAWIATGAAND